MPAYALVSEHALKIDLRQKMKRIRPTLEKNKKPLEAKDIPFDPVHLDVIRYFEPLKDRVTLTPETSSISWTPKASEGRPSRVAGDKAGLQEVFDVLNYAYKNELSIDPEQARFIGNLAVYRASEYLQSLGVRIGIHYFFKEAQVSLVILPEGPHALNQFAARMHARYKSEEVRYDPIFLIKQRFGAAISPDTRTVWIPHRLVKSTSVKDESLLHEIAHLLTLERAERKEVRGEYGSSTAASDGSLPLGFADELYKNYLSHDEMETYFRTAKHALRTLSKLLKSGGDVQGALESLTQNSQTGLSLCARLLRISQLLLTTERWSPADITYHTDKNGIISSVIHWETEGSGPLETTLPLVNAVDDQPSAENVALIQDQLRLLRELARYRYRQFQVLRRVISRIEENPGVEERLRLIRAVRSALPMKESDGRQPSLKELIDRFNQTL
jgi:hypothetical protein